MSNLDFESLRKKRGVTSSSSGGFDFDAYRNRTATTVPVQEEIVPNPILQSTLSGVGAGKPEPVFMGQQQKIQPTPVQSTPVPVQEDNGGGIMGAVDGFNAFTDRAKSAATFGLTKLVDQLFTKIGTDESKQAKQEQLDRANNAKGGMVADILGSLVSGQAAYKAGSAIVNPLIKNVPKLAQGLARGAAAGAAFEVPRQAAEEVGERFGGDKQTTAQRLKNVGISTALGGLTDLGVGAGGMASKGIANPFLSKAAGGAIGVGSLGAALGTANELQQAASGQQQSLGGRLGDVAKSTAAGATLGIAGGTAFAKLLRRNGVPEEQVTEILALPEGRGTIRQAEASGRSVNPAGSEPIINPSDFKTEPLGLPQGDYIPPTTARVGTKTNIYRQKFENLIAEAQKRPFSPGREDIELENLWGQMAERTDPGLDELVSLAYPKKTTPTPQRGMIESARLRAASGDSPVLSSSERFPSTIESRAAAPQTVAGRVGGTPKAEVSEPITRRVAEPESSTTAPISREQEIVNKGKNLSQDDIDYLMSGNFDESKITENRRPRTEVSPEVTKETTPLVDAAPDVTAQKQHQDMITDLFGDQSLGISANGNSRRVGTGPANTEDQIVRNGIKNDKEGIKQAIKSQARNTYQNLVDHLDPLKRISDDTYESAMDSTRANNLANTIVRDKFVNLEGKVIGESLQGIFKKVAKGRDRKFVDYINLRHALTRESRGETVFAKKLEMTPAKIQENIDRLESQYPGFENIAKEWDKFNDNVLREIGVKEGLISPELYNALREKNPNYSPQRRQFLRSEKPSRGFVQKSTKSSFSGQKAPLQEVSPTGSTRDIIDPRKSTIEAVGSWTNAALRNRTMQSMVDAVKRDPEAFKGVAEIVQKPKSATDLKDILTNGGQDDFLEALDGDFKDLFKTSNVDGDNIVRAMVNGEPVYLKVYDPEIVKTLIGMGPQASNILIDVMRAFSNWTKRGATGALAPAFAIKGTTMDLTSSAIQSKRPIKQAAYTVYSIFSGIGDSLDIPGLRNWAQEYRRSGGGYTAALKGDTSLNKSISNMSRQPALSRQGLAKGAVTAVTAPFKILEGIGNIAENAPRIAASKIERQSLGNEITPQNIRRVMNAGREATVNYSRKGALTRDIEAFVPYNNAAVQGTYRVLKALTNPKTAVRTVGAIATLSVLPKLYEYSKFHDDSDYQQLPARERMRFLIVNKNSDGTFTKIPMEPAYNSFGEMTIEALRYFKDKDPTSFKGTMDALANAWTPPLVTGAIQGLTKGGGAEASIAGVVNSTVAAPFVATVANKSFTGAPIVSQSLQDRSRQYQYDERTSSIAKKLGEGLNMSPQKVDYIIKAYGGDLARLVLPLTSDVGKGNVRNTLLKNFIVDPAFSNTLTDDFYDAKDKLNQAYANFNEAGVELPKWYNDDLRKALNSSAKGSISKDLSELRNYKKEITSDKTMTDKQRTDKLREIQQRINEIYININSVLKDNGVVK